jgi:hypothetical protein
MPSILLAKTVGERNALNYLIQGDTSTEKRTVCRPECDDAAAAMGREGYQPATKRIRAQFQLGYDFESIHSAVSAGARC